MDGPRNMARDHALASALPAGQAALRIYRWERPTLSLGRNEPAAGGYDLRRAKRRGVAFVRRPTGGRAVLHDAELTYALAVPARALGGPRQTHRAVSGALVEALRSLGVPAELAPPAPPSFPGAGPCFHGASEGEVTVRGRKLAGSAQVRLGGVLLQHGSLLVAPARVDLGELWAGGGLPADSAPTSLEEVMGAAPPWNALVQAVLAALSEGLGATWEGRARVDPEMEARLCERYASDAWTWRR
jgi:lipoate-protein ligase A